MRRLTRHLFTLCSAASLVLCVAVCVLWLRTGRSIEELTWGAPRGDRFHHFRLVSATGKIRAEWVNVDKGWADGREWDRFRWTATAPAGDTRFWSRAFQADHVVNAPGHIWAAQVPHWFAVLVCLALPLAVFGSRMLRRRRPVPGRCPSCGYDLRASPGRCPECGRAAASNESGRQGA